MELKEMPVIDLHYLSKDERIDMFIAKQRELAKAIFMKLSSEHLSERDKLRIIALAQANCIYEKQDKETDAEFLQRLKKSLEERL